MKERMMAYIDDASEKHTNYLCGLEEGEQFFSFSQVLRSSKPDKDHYDHL